MINCPKCKELIGEDYNRCPMCGYDITDEDIAKIKKTISDRESKEYQYRKELIQTSAKKRQKYGIFYLVSLALIFVGMFLTLATEEVLWVNILVPVSITAALATLIIGHVNGALCCPHCGASLFRNNKKYCTYCGGRLY